MKQLGLLKTCQFGELNRKRKFSVKKEALLAELRGFSSLDHIVTFYYDGNVTKRSPYIYACVSIEDMYMDWKGKEQRN